MEVKVLEEGEPGFKELIELLTNLRQIIELEDDNLDLIIIQINTPQKVKALDEWIEENTVDGKPTFNEIQLMNKTAKISHTM